MVEYVDSVKYLGTTIQSRPNFEFSCVEELRSFYRAANALLNTLKKPREEVLMYLIYTNAVPILTYCSAVKAYTAREMNDCNTALNDCIRKIFGFHRWESIRELRVGLGYKSLTELFAKSKRNFEIGLATHCNPILRSLNSILEDSSRDRVTIN